jgi:hypothetical protein
VNPRRRIVALLAHDTLPVHTIFLQHLYAKEVLKSTTNTVRVTYAKLNW